MEIDTERLRLRRITAGDLDTFVAMHADPALIRFMGRFDHADAVRWLEHVDDSWATRGYGRIGITDRVTGELLGRTGLEYFPAFGEAELGWTLWRNGWGHGYATEAAAAFRDWALTNFALPRVVSFIEAANGPSRAVAARLGMTPLREGVFEGHLVTVHALARERWEQHQQQR